MNPHEDRSVDYWAPQGQHRLDLEREQKYERWLRDVRTKPMDADAGGCLLVLFTIAATALTMVAVGTAAASAGATRVHGPRILLALPGVLAGLAVFYGAGRLFFNLSGDAPMGRRRAARACVAAAGLAMLVWGAGLVYRHRAGASTPPPPDPAVVAAQAAADFEQAMRLLAEGNVTDSVDRYEAAMAHRPPATDVKADPGFKQWCDARQAEYREAVAKATPSLGRRVEVGERTLRQVDDFLRRGGTHATREVWKDERPAVERRLATAAAARSYRLALQVFDAGDDSEASTDAEGADEGKVGRLDEDDEAALKAAIAARLGGARPACLFLIRSDRLSNGRVLFQHLPQRTFAVSGDELIDRHHAGVSLIAVAVGQAPRRGKPL